MSHQKPKRQSISKATRFEIFKRDKFTCQYCGKKSPEVILHVDHIEPVSKGGINDYLNLITSCIDCNLGKGARTLSDTTIFDRKRSQIEELQERREQIEMMLDWQRELLKLDRYLVEKVAEFWTDLVRSHRLSDQGLQDLEKLLKHRDANEVMEAMRIAVKQYLKYDNSSPTQESVDYAWSKVKGICSLRKQEKSKPYMRDLFYIRGILRKRLNYVNEWLSIKLLEEAYEYGASPDKLKEHACEVHSWKQWKKDIEEFIRSFKETETNNDESNKTRYAQEIYSQSKHESREEEFQTNINLDLQFTEACNLYAAKRAYGEIADLCNQYLDIKAPHIQEFIDDFNHWFITIKENRFTVDLTRLQEYFNKNYKHWSIDYYGRCIYTWDGNYEYDIGFDTIRSERRKYEWVELLKSKTWSTPEMIAELSEILRDSYYISLGPQPQ